MADRSKFLGDRLKGRDLQCFETLVVCQMVRLAVDVWLFFLVHADCCGDVVPGACERSDKPGE